jgi:hypothetical protein
MPNFELSFPVVGSIKLSSTANSGDAFLVADTYFDPLMEAALKARWINGTPKEAAPRLLTMWQERTGAFDIEGGAHEFDPADGLVPLLEEAGRFLPVFSTERLQPVGRPAPATLEEVRLALVAFFNLAIQSGSPLTVEDIP